MICARLSAKEGEPIIMKPKVKKRVAVFAFASLASVAMAGTAAGKPAAVTSSAATPGIEAAKIPAQKESGNAASGVQDAVADNDAKHADKAADNDAKHADKAADND